MHEFPINGAPMSPKFKSSIRASVARRIFTLEILVSADEILFLFIFFQAAADDELIVWHQIEERKRN